MYLKHQTGSQSILLERDHKCWVFRPSVSQESLETVGQWVLCCVDQRQGDRLYPCTDIRVTDSHHSLEGKVFTNINRVLYYNILLRDNIGVLNTYHKYFGLVSLSATN